MRRRAIAAHGREAGGSAVSFVMVLPILIALACAIVDLGRLVFVGAELDSATQAACKWASGQLSVDGMKSISNQEISQAVRDASPSLTSAGLRCSATLRCSDAADVVYTRRSYHAESGVFEEQADLASRVEVSVSSTLEGSYLTPLGLVLSSQGNGIFDLSSCAVRLVHVAKEADDAQG